MFSVVGKHLVHEEGREWRAEETRGGWALPPKVQHPPAEIPGCAPGHRSTDRICRVGRFAIALYKWYRHERQKDDGLSARRCLTPSSPNSSSSFCPLLLGSAPGVMLYP